MTVIQSKIPQGEGKLDGASQGNTDITIVGSPRRQRHSKARRASQQLQEILNRSSMYGSNTSLASECPSQADSTVSLKERLRHNQKSFMELLSQKNLPFRNKDSTEKGDKDKMSSQNSGATQSESQLSKTKKSLSQFSAQLEALVNAPVPKRTTPERLKHSTQSSKATVNGSIPQLGRPYTFT